MVAVWLHLSWALPTPILYLAVPSSFDNCSFVCPLVLQSDLGMRRFLVTLLVLVIHGVENTASGGQEV